MGIDTLIYFAEPKQVPKFFAEIVNNRQAIAQFKTKNQQPRLLIFMVIK
jgi:hypothetical protein